MENLGFIVYEIVLSFVRGEPYVDNMSAKKEASLLQQ